MLHAEKRFREIARLHNAQLQIEDEDIDIGGGVRSPNLVMKMKVNYKKQSIVIINRTGHDFNGHSYCKILYPTMTGSFEMYTRSHFMTLFFGKRNRFKLLAKNTNLKSFLKRSSSLAVLKNIANQDVFEPSITGKLVNNGYNLYFDYHLQFDDWTEVITPIINFYKEFLDSFRANN